MLETLKIEVNRVSFMSNGQKHDYYVKMLCKNYTLDVTNTLFQERALKVHKERPKKLMLSNFFSPSLPLHANNFENFRRQDLLIVYCYLYLKNVSVSSGLTLSQVFLQILISFLNLTTATH